MILVIVGGRTSTGKSTLARRLGSDLHLTVCHKDTYKEMVYYPSLTGKTSFKEWLRSEKLSWQEVYRVICEAQRSDSNVLVEGDFTGSQQRKIQHMLVPQTRVVEIYCYARGFTTYCRFMGRSKSGERHPGHRDERWYWIAWLGALAAYVGWRWCKPLWFGEALLKVDTTDFQAVDYGAIREFVSKALR